MALVVTAIYRPVTWPGYGPARCCPLCQGRSRVLQTLDHPGGNTVRYRKCLACHYRFTTRETRAA